MSSTASEPARDQPFSFRCGYKNQSRSETWQQFERFCFYLTLGPARTITAVARRFQVALPTVSAVAKRFNWAARAKAWDDFGCTGVDVAGFMASQSDIALKKWNIPASDLSAHPLPQTTVQVVRAELLPEDHSLERRSPMDIEAFRLASERLGRHHMTASLEMVDSARVVQARLHTMLHQWAQTTEQMELADAVNASQGLAELAMKLSRTIASLAASSAQLATAGADRWGAALGIDTIMGQLQQFLMQQEAEKAAAAAGSTLPVGQEVSP